MLVAVVKAMRPHQWVKNLFVLAPLVFAEQALEVSHLWRAALAFAIFSALSGCVYILNDLMDVEQDRQHPTKRRRPIASGALPVPMARTALGVVLLVSVGLSFALLPTAFAAVVLAYFSLNVAYSFALKHVPFVDVGCIATGFLLRLIGGAVAVEVPMTVWILVTTFLLALTLALGKRKHEIQQAGEKKKEQRKVLERYDLAHVTWAMNALAVATPLCYAAYCFFGKPLGRLFHPRDMAWTIPFVVLGLFRFVQLTNRSEDGRSPTDMILRDWPFLAIVLGWSLAVVIIIYVH